MINDAIYNNNNYNPSENKVGQKKYLITLDYYLNICNAVSNNKLMSNNI